MGKWQLVTMWIVIKSLELNKKQTEKLADLVMDLGKLVFASLVLGLFQTDLGTLIFWGVAMLGLTIALGLFIFGIGLLKEVKR